MLATDLAEYLVRKGVPFRETHHIAGAAVRMAELRAVPLSELGLTDLQTLHKAFAEDVFELWDFERSVEQRDVQGGTSRRAVQAQIDGLQNWLAETGGVQNPGR
jgi:argininosuccinate lyase